MVILGIGAHPDDIEIGCGGSLAFHSRKGDEVHMLTFSLGEQGGAEADVREKEALAASKIIGAKSYRSFNYPDTEIPFDRAAVKKLEEVIMELKPQRVFIPFDREIHQDHTNTNKISLIACRNVPQILMYEGPSTYTDFQAAYWIDISTTLDIKTASVSCHKSQGDKELLKIKAVEGMNKFRGLQVRVGYAEGFAVFRFVELC